MPAIPTLVAGLVLFGVGAFPQTKPEPKSIGPEAAQSTAPKLPDSLLKEYWRAVAAHHALNAGILQLKENLAAADKAIDDMRHKLQAVCGDKAVLNDNGPEPVCLSQSSATR